jgi:hypothetical protein
MNCMSKIIEFDLSFDMLKTALDYFESLITIVASVLMAFGYWFLLMDP